MITKETIQQIQSRIDIIEIIGSFVKLKKRGATYLGLCPFHNEKTPSFTVSPSKEIYKCFGCGKSGNAITFLMESEKYSYVEALRWLAQKYNVEIEEKQVSNEQILQQQVADSLYILNSFAQQFFTEQLFHTEEGISVGLSYLKERGYREDIIKKFELGYNTEARNELSAAAIKKQYSGEMLVKAGLSVDRDGQYIDNYRNRIIFPIHNQTGKILGFGARIIKTNDRAPKYINTPENEIYVKSKILYGSYFARQAINKLDECLLVEGYTDVISLHQAGIENVCASGGTSLTVDQLRLVKKFTNNLTILYDGDSAGVKAALRGLDLALEQGLNVKLVLIPDNEDPDSYVNKVGAAAFIEFVKNNKKDFILFQLDLALADAGTDSVKKSKLVNQMAETLSKLNKTEEFTQRQDYIRRVADILKIEEAGLNTLVNKIMRESISKEFQQQANQQQSYQELSSNPPLKEIQDEEIVELLASRDELSEQAIVKVLLEFGSQSWDDDQTVAQFLFEELYDEGELMLGNELLARIFRNYETLYKEGIQPTEKTFLYDDDRELSIMVVKLMDGNLEISPNWHRFYEGKILSRAELYRENVISALGYLKLRKVKMLINENLKLLEHEKDPEEYMLIIQTNAHLKEMEKAITSKWGTVILK